MQTQFHAFAQMRDDQETQRAKILEDIQTVVKNQAVLAGYKMVLDKKSVSLTGLPVVVYSESSADITDSVLKELNTGYNKKQEEPAKK